MNQYRPAKTRIEVSVGESVRIIRELQGLSQNHLAELSEHPAGDPFGDRKQPRPSRCGAGDWYLHVRYGATAAVLDFPGWEQPVETAA